MDKLQFEKEQPVVAETQVDSHATAGSSAASETLTTAEEEVVMVKKRLKEIEEETETIRARFEKENGAQGEHGQEDAGGTLSQAAKEEVDSRSVYVGNVDYTCTPEELQQHFESCGTVNRITILTDAFGNPKGYAYVEFVETEAVENAVRLNESELHGRQLKVSPKRTNVPGMKQHRGRRFPRGPFMPGTRSYPPSPYRRASRYRPPMRYSPY